ncbi:hypothetical protein N8Z26_04205 [Burkholderiales bacterium]|nr:hypothetical protein [Burkholderiales bacterium]
MKFINKLTAQHIARYPNLELRDLYKLLHQSALGASHANATDDVLEKEFNLELDNLCETHVEPAIDPISPDGKIARIHIRSYLAQKYSTENLLSAFIQTTKNHNGSKEKLQKFCNCLKDLSKARQLPFSPEETEAFVTDIESKDYPTLRHSDVFRQEYDPSYRIVHLDFLQLSKFCNS